jgi:anti-anti-sigma factor
MGEAGKAAVAITEVHGRLLVTGDLDMAGGECLERVLLDIDDAGRVVHLDLSGVTFVDSTGLRSLLAASRRAQLDGRRLRLVNPSAVVRRLLEITATTDLFEVVSESGGVAPGDLPMDGHGQVPMTTQPR